jgi:IS30 family transposase
VAQARLSVRKIREVLRLEAEARLSDREIAAVVGSARSTVQECLRLAWEVASEPENRGRRAN